MQVPYVVLAAHLFSGFFNCIDLSGDRGRVAQWLRRSATNRKVAGSIQAGVIGIFH